jgi:hypothetical protein
MAFMNYLVYLDTRAGELERILSGVKTMLVREFDPAHPPAYPINPGDSLYFLRDQGDCALRVKAAVVRVLIFTNNESLILSLKAMQPRLQLTEEQYIHWSASQQALLVEFEAAQKIGMIRVSPEKITGRPDWIAFEDFSRITE